LLNGGQPSGRRSMHWASEKLPCVWRRDPQADARAGLCLSTFQTHRSAASGWVCRIEHDSVAAVCDRRNALRDEQPAVADRRYSDVPKRSNARVGFAALPPASGFGVPASAGCRFRCAIAKVCRLKPGLRTDQTFCGSWECEKLAAWGVEPGFREPGAERSSRKSESTVNRWEKSR